MKIIDSPRVRAELDFLTHDVKRLQEWFWLHGLKVEIDGVRVSDVQGVVMPEGVMRGSLLGMSFLSKLQSFKVEDGVLYLKN